MATALVVDDSRVIRKLLSQTLNDLGFETVGAADGQEALEALERGGGAIGFAMVDWNMPNVNGLEFVQRVRSRPEYDGVRLVMVTTETEIDQMIRALEAGANEYLMKPFTAAAVEDKLRLAGVLR
jgi:two-component system chemotaxis response regulator CheY